MPMMVETRELDKAFGDHVVLEGLQSALYIPTGGKEGTRYAD
jgi:hypothetical protein